MRVPLEWLRRFVELPLDPRSVAGMLAQLGFPVERIEERPAISGVVAGRIVELRKHPNADRLQVGSVDVGADEPLTIATAATNVAAGQLIGVATVGARLPQLTIVRRTMRGIESQGMMISAEELALEPQWFEDGILQLDGGATPGDDLVERFGLLEPVLDVEITSNRVDAMSILGLARELAAFQGTTLRLPGLDASPSQGNESPNVVLESADCLRFVAQRFTGIRVGVSPVFMRIRLALAGQRPINSIVDIANYVMLEVGEPLHFYDAAKVRGNEIVVRDAREDEQLTTLDGVDRRLTPRALVIADGRAALGLAGLMGGIESEVTPATEAIVLESATFNGTRIRRMSAQLGLRTAASARHERSPAEALAELGARRAAVLLTEAGAVAHEARTFGPPPAAAPPIEFPIADVARILGFAPSPQECSEFLDRLGFAVRLHDERIAVTPPSWRRDVAMPADVIEEIARIAGYDRIEAAIPSVRAHDIDGTDYRRLQDAAAVLRALDYHEIVTYALHGASILARFAAADATLQSTALEVLNPLSEDQRYLRTSLVPAMLDYFARIGRPIRSFEAGHVFVRGEREPIERTALTFGFCAEAAGDAPWRDDLFLALKSDCEELLRSLIGDRAIEAFPEHVPGMHPGKSAALRSGGKVLAEFGRVDPRVEAAFDLRLAAYAATVYPLELPAARPPRYAAPSRYPSTYRDLAVVCDEATPAAALQAWLAAAIGRLCTAARVFDEYRGPQVPSGRKSLAVRLTLQRYDRTITDDEADEAVAQAVASLGGRGITLRH